AVVPYQDREVAETPLVLQRLARDPLRDLLGLVSAAHVLEVIDLDLIGRRPPDETFVDPKTRLEPLGVVLDEPIRGVEQALPGAAVLDERDYRRVRVGSPEGVEVAEGGAAPGECRLGIVADAG